MTFKVYGGTPALDNPTLCANCRFARIIRGQRLEEEVIFCDAIAMHAVRITFKVAACSSFIDDREPTYHELLEKAWILQPGTRRRAAGFVRASDLSHAETMRLFTELKDGE
jgi:hypothetical protein